MVSMLVWQSMVGIVKVESIDQTAKCDKMRMVNTIDLPYPAGKETKQITLYGFRVFCFHI